MKYEVKPDAENDILRLVIFSSLDKTDVDEMMPVIARELDNMKRRLVLVDMSHDKNPSSMSKEARRAYSEHSAIIKPDKVAMVGANPVTRMIAKIALSIMGRSNITRFFASEEDALAWLKGDAKR